MKECGLCGVAKEPEEFHRRGRGTQAWCKDCRRRYDADYHRRTRELRLAQKQARRRELASWYRDLKTSRPCAECGGYFHHAAMEWDHLPGFVKTGVVSNLRFTSRRRVLEEIAKCELVCANCHAVRSHHRQRGVAQPG